MSGQTLPGTIPGRGVPTNPGPGLPGPLTPRPMGSNPLPGSGIDLKGTLHPIGPSPQVTPGGMHATPQRGGQSPSPPPRTTRHEDFENCLRARTMTALKGITWRKSR